MEVVPAAPGVMRPVQDRVVFSSTRILSNVQVDERCCCLLLLYVEIRERPQLTSDERPSLFVHASFR
jgi:hypothetical protein